MAELENPGSAVSPLTEKFCFVRLAELGDGAAIAACLYEGAEDTYPHPRGKFGATEEAVRTYLDEALRLCGSVRAGGIGIGVSLPVGVMVRCGWWRIMTMRS